MTFVHLHNHSEYSILDGAARIKDMVRAVSHMGQHAVAVTDHGTLSGAASFRKECLQQGVKPIIGVEAYVAPHGVQDRSRVVWGHLQEDGKSRPVPGAYTHMTLLALDSTGLRNLYHLQELSYLKGYYYKPRIDLDMLAEHSEGIVVTTGCAGGAVATMMRLEQQKEAQVHAATLADIFPGRCYIELMDHGIPWEKHLNQGLAALAAGLGLPMVATNDSHYVYESDSHIHDALLCVQTRAKISDTGRFRFNGSGYYLKSAAEMAALGLPGEALKNTVVIADQVGDYDELFSRKDLMPRALPNELGRKLSLRQEVYLSLIQNWEWVTEGHEARAEHELSIIEGMGYEDYFLVISDIVCWARSRGILVGPGRGSVGGSLVAYLLGISRLDPLAHGLLFERFLNPARVSAPDIDIDIQDDRRDEVIKYAVERYGSDRVAQIITFGTIKSRAALKDANRVLGGDFSTGESLVQRLPPMVRGRQAPLEASPELREVDSQVYGLALGIEGLIRSTGKHAAGIIISPEPLRDYVPLQKTPNDEMLVTGYSQDDVEELGLHKIDLLGLKELSIIQKTLEIIDEEGISST